MSERGRGPVAGVLARYRDVSALIAACRGVRDAGYVKWDSMSPFPVHGIDRAMGLQRTILPKIVFVGGLTGTLAGLAMQWWMNAIDYPYIISGKPYFSLPAQIPIIFEVTILFAAITAFAGMITLNGLPRLHHPLFTSELFRRATTDGFFVWIEAEDPKFDASGTRALLERLGSEAVEEVFDAGTE